MTAHSDVRHDPAQTDRPSPTRRRADGGAIEGDRSLMGNIEREEVVFWLGVVSEAIKQDDPDDIRDAFAEAAGALETYLWILEGSSGAGPLNIAAAMMGRSGGKAGGLARAAALAPERRREIAQQAARARWSRRSENGR